MTRYSKHPACSRAALAMASTHLHTVRAGKGMLAIVLAGGAASQVAAWATDAVALYVAGHSRQSERG